MLKLSLCGILTSKDPHFACVLPGVQGSNVNANVGFLELGPPILLVNANVGFLEFKEVVSD